MHFRKKLIPGFVFTKRICKSGINQNIRTERVCCQLKVLSVVIYFTLFTSALFYYFFAVCIVCLFFVYFVFGFLLCVLCVKAK